MKNNDIIFLYKVCSDFNIDFDVDEYEIEIFKKSIEEKRKYIKKIESSFIWLWINSKNEKDKNKIIELYISQVVK